MLKIIKVTGNSLSPFILSGDFVLISTSHRQFKNLKEDDPVVFNHPEYGRLIKLIDKNYPDSENLKVTGIHEESISSHKLGLIPYSDLIGRVIFHIKQPRSM
ncbi:MAG TPA: hypothetical protein ENF22_07285 [Chloroflexi bacterium]|nr:hypothetical protein [Chloroflexota bacterium]